MARGSKIGEAYVELRASMDALKGDLADARGGISSWFGMATAVAAGNALTSGIGALFQGAMSLRGAFIEASAGVERYTTTLSVMLKSDQLAGTYFRRIQDFAAKTPFEIQNLMQSFISLKNAGFKLGDILPNIRKIGDAASAAPGGLAVGLERVMRAISQIKTKGKLQSGEMTLQLGEAGIPAWDLLAKKVGKTKTELMKMSEAGQLTADKYLQPLIDAMGEKFAGMMERQSQTWEGLTSTLKDNWAIFLQYVGSPIFDLAKSGLKDLVAFLDTDTFKNFQERARESMQSVANFLARVGDKAKTLIGPLVEVVSNIKNAFFEMIADINGEWDANDPFGPSMAESAWATFDSIMEGVRSAIDYVGLLTSNYKTGFDIIATYGKLKFSELIQWLKGDEKSLFNGIWERFTQGASIAFDAITSLFGVVAKTISEGLAVAFEAVAPVLAELGRMAGHLAIAIMDDMILAVKGQEGGNSARIAEMIPGAVKSAARLGSQRAGNQIGDWIAKASEEGGGVITDYMQRAKEFMSEAVGDGAAGKIKGYQEELDRLHGKAQQHRDENRSQQAADDAERAARRQRMLEEDNAFAEEAENAEKGGGDPAASSTAGKGFAMSGLSEFHKSIQQGLGKSIMDKSLIELVHMSKKQYEEYRKTNELLAKQNGNNVGVATAS